jgi:hypothetical protein
VAYVRTVKTASGATAVQIVYSARRGAARRMEHVGSAHDEQELEALKSAARQRLAQPELDLGLDSTTAAVAAAVVGPGPLPIVSSRAGRLWDGLGAAYDQLGFEQAAGRDEVFRQLVLARISRPASSTACGYWPRPVSTRFLPTPRSSGACPATPPTSSAESSPKPALHTLGSGRRRWCSTT